MRIGLEVPSGEDDRDLHATGLHDAGETRDCVMRGPPGLPRCFLAEVSEGILSTFTPRDGCVDDCGGAGDAMRTSTISNWEREDITEGQAIGAISTVLWLPLTMTVMWNEILSEGTSARVSGKTRRA
jgi:hypothetical protein